MIFDYQMLEKILTIFIIGILLISLSQYVIPNVDAEKTLELTQKCDNTALMIFITNQDGLPVKNAKIFHQT